MESWGRFVWLSGLLGRRGDCSRLRRVPGAWSRCCGAGRRRYNVTRSPCAGCQRERLGCRRSDFSALEVSSCPKHKSRLKRIVARLEAIRHFGQKNNPAISDRALCYPRFARSANTNIGNRIRAIIIMGGPPSSDGNIRDSRSGNRSRRFRAWQAQRYSPDDPRIASCNSPNLMRRPRSIQIYICGKIP